MSGMDWFSLISGVLSLLIGVAGLILTVLAMRAAVSARDAAREALEEAKRRVGFFTVTKVYGSAHQLIELIRDEAWGKAEMRSRDLAEQMAYLPPGDANWVQFASDLRDLAAVCQKLDKKAKVTWKTDSWNKLLKDLLTELDKHHKPLP